MRNIIHSRKGGISVPVKIILAILIFMVVFALMTLIFGKSDSIEEEIMTQNEIYVGGECAHIETDDDDLSTGSENQFTVDLGGIYVRDIEYLWLEFDWHTIGDGAVIESWDATCYDGPELFDAPVVFEEDEGRFEGGEDTDGDGNYFWNAQTTVVESNGYETEVNCQHKIIVDITVADRIFAGTDADVYLCYYPAVESEVLAESEATDETLSGETTDDESSFTEEIIEGIEDKLSDIANAFNIADSHNPDLVCDPACDAGFECTGLYDDTHCCMEGTYWNGIGCFAPGLMIVALKDNLENSYSGDELVELEQKIDELIAAVGKEDIGAEFLYLDDDETKAQVPGGKCVTDSDDVTDISSVLIPLLKKQKSKYLIIIGGYEAFPQKDIGPDPFDDFDERAYSDDQYGDLDGDGIVDIPVGRFPDPNDGDIDVLLNALDTAIRLHEAGGIDIRDNYFANMNESYDGLRFHQNVIESSCDADSDNCEKYIEDCQLPQFDKQDFASLDLHGSTGEQTFGCNSELECGCAWGGSGGPQFDSSSVDNLDVENAAWFMMPCSSSKLDDKDKTKDSIPMTFLENGGAFYIGSTCIVPAGNGCIGEMFTEIANKIELDKMLGAEIRFGDAFMTGKNNYIERYNCQEGKTEYQYHMATLFGDPTIPVKSIW